VQAGDFLASPLAQAQRRQVKQLVPDAEPLFLSVFVDGAALTKASARGEAVPIVLQCLNIPVSERMTQDAQAILSYIQQLPSTPHSDAERTRKSATLKFKNVQMALVFQAIARYRNF
jgi:hypothetical protein